MRMTQTMSVKVDTKKNCEQILSGNFMVSNFEQELDEYQDDYTDDNNDDEVEEIITDSSNSKILPSTSAGVCMQLEKYRPLTPDKQYEIDSDLSQIFNTLNVTYK
jgi:hypothetical protein